MLTLILIIVGLYLLYLILKQVRLQTKNVKLLEDKIISLERSSGERQLDVGLLTSSIVDDMLAKVKREESKRSFAEYLLKNEEGLKEFSYGSVAFAIEKYGEKLTKGEFDHETDKRGTFLAYAIGYGIEKNLSLQEAVLKTNQILMSLKTD